MPYGSQRRDVTVYISYDEGETWPVKKTIVPYSSAYSSLCVLPDGTIGLYVEEEPNGTSGYSTAFYNFSLEWLTDGADVYGFESVSENTDNDSLKIYPNPAISSIKIESDGLKKLKIVNVKGQTVKKVSVKNQSVTEIDITKLHSGTYLIEAVDFNGDIKFGKFIK